MRILKYHLPLALLSGLVVAAVLQLSAWYNLRDQTNVCRRQGRTRHMLSVTGERIDEYQQKTGGYPKNLVEVFAEQGDPQAAEMDAQLVQQWTLDEWGNPFQYSVGDNGFTLKSLGRDGKPGGVGLDADLYHDDRNHEETLATFRQFFTESDTAEVDRGPSIILSLLAAVVVALTLFSNLVKEDRQEPFSLRYMLLAAGFVVIGAVAIGLFLLPLHIPSGH